jgi:hypothetical protein
LANLLKGGLQRIREIRISEWKFCQWIIDIYVSSINYDVTAKSIKRFFYGAKQNALGGIRPTAAKEIAN